MSYFSFYGGCNKNVDYKRIFIKSIYLIIIYTDDTIKETKTFTTVSAFVTSISINFTNFEGFYNDTYILMEEVHNILR